MRKRFLVIAIVLILAALVTIFLLASPAAAPEVPVVPIAGNQSVAGDIPN